VTAPAALPAARRPRECRRRQRAEMRHGGTDARDRGTTSEQRRIGEPERQSRQPDVVRDDPRQLMDVGIVPLRFGHDPHQNGRARWHVHRPDHLLHIVVRQERCRVRYPGERTVDGRRVARPRGTRLGPAPRHGLITRAPRRIPLAQVVGHHQRAGRTGSRDRQTSPGTSPRRPRRASVRRLRQGLALAATGATRNGARTCAGNRLRAKTCESVFMSCNRPLPDRQVRATKSGRLQ
jgi:hypothetical protein